jgi:hypothetical protein
MTEPIIKPRSFPVPAPLWREAEPILCRKQHFQQKEQPRLEPQKQQSQRISQPPTIIPIIISKYQKNNELK